MYVGHVAIAIALKAREPRLPVVPLVIASFGPDWAELVLGVFRTRAEMEALTHWIPGVIAGALIAALLYALVLRRPGAPYIALAWLLHWPADFFTAHKPLLDPNHVVGLDLYHLPAVDFVLEASLVGVACMLYARAFARQPSQRRWVLTMAVALIGLQGILDFGLARTDGSPWNPSLAWRPRRPHLTRPVSIRPAAVVRMPLALSAGTFTASAQWQRRVLVA